MSRVLWGGCWILWFWGNLTAPTIADFVTHRLGKQHEWKIIFCLLLTLIGLGWVLLYSFRWENDDGEAESN